jgi:hypothetical protein
MAATPRSGCRHCLKRLFDSQRRKIFLYLRNSALEGATINEIKGFVTGKLVQSSDKAPGHSKADLSHICAVQVFFAPFDSNEEKGS